jgi:hypothetical protein
VQKLEHPLQLVCLAPLRLLAVRCPSQSHSSCRPPPPSSSYALVTVLPTLKQVMPQKESRATSSRSSGSHQLRSRGLPPCTCGVVGAREEVQAGSRAAGRYDGSK